ncbi:MAG: ABC transporter permease [Enterococcus sp.]
MEYQEANHFVFFEQPDVETVPVAVAKKSNTALIFSKFKKDLFSTFWVFILATIVAIALIGPHLFDYNPDKIDTSIQNVLPSAQHWFGTDKMGRDLFIRTCEGVQISLLIALVSTFVSIVFGTIYGALMAYFGGTVDRVMMWIIQVLNSLPSLLITMLILTVMGNSMVTMLFALTITSWSHAARQARGLVLHLESLDYVVAAKMLHTPIHRLILKHFVPNMMSILILDLGHSIPANIFAEAGLSFLGIGLQPPNTSLGILISEGQQQMLQQPSQLYIPVAILVLLVFSFNIIGDGLRDALDPKYAK